MKIIKDSTPSADGFHMPAEYERNEGYDIAGARGFLTVWRLCCQKSIC